MDDEITISSEVDKRNNALCRFMINRTIYIGSISFTGKQEAQGMPFAEKLFEIEGVTKISFIGHLLIVTKTDDYDWKEIGKRVEAVITAYFVSGFALTREDVQDRMLLVGKTAKEKVQYLLDHKINPGVAAHAGFVELLDVKDGVLYLRLGGGCQGCGAVDFTLKQGITAIIQREVPEIRQILDVTDHAAGMNPYYRRS